jgi:hypothetical protein
MRERVQALYLLKSETADSITHLARIPGRNHITVQRWLSKYQPQSPRWSSSRYPAMGANKAQAALTATARVRELW